MLSCTPAQSSRTGELLHRRDADFLDARCALIAFLYASGRRAEAEGQWETLQQSQGDFRSRMRSTACIELPCCLCAASSRVEHMPQAFFHVFLELACTHLASRIPSMHCQCLCRRPRCGTVQQADCSRQDARALAAARERGPAGFHRPVGHGGGQGLRRSHAYIQLPYLVGGRGGVASKDARASLVSVRATGLSLGNARC